MVIHWRFSDSKFPRVSWTLLCFLNDFSNAFDWKVSIPLLNTNSFILFLSFSGPFQVHQLQLVSPSTSSSTPFYDYFRALHTCFSMMSKWQQVASGFPDSSDHSGRSKHWSSLNGLGFQFFPPSFLVFGDRSKSVNYNWYNCHPQVTLLSWFSRKGHVYDYLYAFFDFHSVVRKNGKIYETASYFFCFFLISTRTCQLNGMK